MLRELGIARGRLIQARQVANPRVGTQRSIDLRRRYLPGTMVLETEYRTASGVCRVIDCMVVGDQHPTLLRVVEGVEGVVALTLELIVRFDYGSIIPWVRKIEPGGIEAIAGPNTLRLYTHVPLRGEGFKTGCCSASATATRGVTAETGDGRGPARPVARRRTSCEDSRPPQYSGPSTNSRLKPLKSHHHHHR